MRQASSVGLPAIRTSAKVARCGESAKLRRGVDVRGRRRRARGASVESSTAASSRVLRDAVSPFVLPQAREQSLDGRIATAQGESRWITGPEARAEVHRLRGFVDGILVGSETALRDDPALTARRGRKVVHRPVRVLLDSKLRVPVGAQLYRGKAEPSWVLCAPGAPAARRRARLAEGARLLEVPVRGRFLDLRAALRRLAREGLTEMLVEGGGELAAALLRAGLVDELHWFTAPRLLGGDGRPALGALGLGSLARSPQLADARVRRMGRDLYLRGALGANR